MPVLSRPEALSYHSAGRESAAMQAGLAVRTATSPTAASVQSVSPVSAGGTRAFAKAMRQHAKIAAPARAAKRDKYEAKRKREEEQRNTFGFCSDEFLERYGNAD